MPHDEFMPSNHTNATTLEMNPMYASVPPMALPTGNSLNVLLVVVIIVVVTLLITCSIGHSRMGPSLWSDIRNTITPPPSESQQSSASPQSTHSTYDHETNPSPTYSVDREHLWSPQPKTFPVKSGTSKSKFQQVLYVCERVSNSSGATMAAARERSCTRYPSVHPSQQHDSRLGYPIQVALPDGETHRHHFNPSLTHSYGPEQETELTRGYIKPPENKSLSDLEGLMCHRAFSTGTLSSRDPSYRCTRTTHRHSAPLGGPHAAPSGAYQCGASPSSSSSSGWSDDGRGSSPRRGRKPHTQKQFFSQLLQSKPDRGHQRGRSGVGSRMPRGASSQPLLPYPSTTTTLADIAVVPCGTARYSQPNYSTSPDAPLVSAESPPPLYSDVVESDCVYQGAPHRTDAPTI